MYVCMYICNTNYTMYVCMHVYMYVCMYVHVCTCMYVVCMYVYICVYMYVYMYTYIICMYTNISSLSNVNLTHIGTISQRLVNEKHTHIKTEYIRNR